LILSVSIRDGQEGPEGHGTYTWTPGATEPVHLVGGWLARDVARGTRVLADAQAGHCLYAVLDTSRPGPPVVQGCSPAALSPDGRYLVTGLTVTDLDGGAGPTTLGPAIPAGPAGTPPRQAAVDALVVGQARWIRDRTFETRLDLTPDRRVGLRCNVPRGPCWQLDG